MEMQLVRNKRVNNNVLTSINFIRQDVHRDKCYIVVMYVEGAERWFMQEKEEEDNNKQIYSKPARVQSIY